MLNNENNKNKTLSIYFYQLTVSPLVRKVKFIQTQIQQWYNNPFVIHHQIYAVFRHLESDVQPLHLTPMPSPIRQSWQYCGVGVSQIACTFIYLTFVAHSVSQQVWHNINELYTFALSWHFPTLLESTGKAKPNFKTSKKVLLFCENCLVKVVLHFSSLLFAKHI